jgi:hypothetical protein
MNTQPQASSRWAPRPIEARLIRVVALVAPIAASIVFVALASKAFPAPLGSFWLYLAWWVVLTGAATLVLIAVDRVARRLLPLAVLFKLSLVFPDNAPSRFRTAVTSRSVGTLEERVAARRVQQLTVEERELAREIKTLTEMLAPQLLNQPGVGPLLAAQVALSWSHKGRIKSEAAFARLAGVAPIPASSGQTIRYRLDRSGDRQLNRALHMIIVTRRRTHEPTIAYIERRTQEGKTRREATRCLKRYLARNLYRLLENGAPPAS